MRSLCVAMLALASCGASGETNAASPTPTGTAPTTGEPIGAVSPEQPLAADRVLASWTGGQVLAGDLQERMANELLAMEVKYRLERYEQQRITVETIVMESLLQEEAKKRGLADVNALLTEEVEKKVPEPSESQIKELYPIAKRQLRGATFEEARPYLVADLIRRAQQERYGIFLEELRQQAGVKIDFPYPELPRIEIPVGDDDPMLGKKDAPVTIVQFAEYQCYYCNQAAPTLDRLMKEYDGKIRIVFKDYPLSSHSAAMPAAVAAHCAGDQGKYWEMNRLLLANQQALMEDDLHGYAKKLGLEMDKFQECTTSGRFEPIIQADLALGSEKGVEATPTFFINGILIPGAQPYDRFAALIDRELQH